MTIAIENLAAALFSKLSAAPLKTGCAESLTGGRVAAAMTSLPGSSAFFQGGVVAYSNQLKVELLGVPLSVISDYGAVSQQCAAAMADGLRRKLSLDAALATTGIAGPDGGSREKPVGLVWLAVATAKGVVTRQEFFSGNREAVTVASVEAALGFFLSVLS